MEQYQIEKKLQEAVTNIEKFGAEYAKAKGISYQMQKMREVVLAMEMKNHLGTNVQKDMEAKASLKYIKHLDGTRIAIEDEQRLKAQYTRWNAQFETLRSLLSLEKAKSRMV